MSTTVNYLLRIALSVGMLFGGVSCSPKHTLEPAKTQEITIPKLDIQRWQMSNGITVLLLENHELPLVTGSLTMRGGTLLERSNGRGVIGAMASQMRQGGTALLTADAFDEELQRLSASISSGAGQETTGVSFTCLSADLPRVFEMFRSVVREPVFDDARISLWKDQALEGIRRRTDEPWTVAGIAFQQLVYGDTPYGRQLRSTDVKKISRTELIKAFKHVVRPDGAYLAVSGAVTRPQLEALINERFADWRSQGSIGNTLPPIPFKPKPGIYFVQLPLSQASVYIGQQGPPRLTPDYAAIDGFNQIFGAGGFGSRLMKKIRAELGLAYGVFGGIYPGPVKGKTFIAFQTKYSSTAEAIDQSLHELLKLQQEPVPVSELNEMKRAVSNGFVFKFDSIEAALARKVTLELLNYPPDYDQTYLPKMQHLEAQEIQDVAQKRWDPSGLVIVVVGDENAFKTLERLKHSSNSKLAKMPVTRLKFKETLVGR